MSKLANDTTTFPRRMGHTERGVILLAVLLKHTKQTPLVLIITLATNHPGQGQFSENNRMFV